ncbi:MAG: hypothetical protein HY907_20295 [Deltaproteobacteria bacterium]|nr:hypothetical protein [Deltaproteobacteria bacterium]
MKARKAAGRVLPAALLAAIATLAAPARATATCNDIVNCVAACYDDRCTRECARYGDATSQALFAAALQCLDTYCPYDSSDACASRNCSYQISQCGADGGGGYAPAGYAPTSYDPGYSGVVADGDIDNFTFKFGGGYVFIADGGLLDMTMGWEHLWVMGPAESASTVQLGLDLLFEMFSGADTVIAVGGAADVKYYFGTNILEELPWFTFGLGAMIGGGTTIGAGWEEEDVPFLIAAPEVSLQWIYPFGGGFDFYGGALVFFGGAEDVAPFVGLRGVMDITLFASNI